MNLVKTLPALLLFYAIPSMAETSVTNVTPINPSNLYGSWFCQHKIEEPNSNMVVDVNYRIQYNQDNTSQGYGILLFTLSGMPKLKYSITDSSTWQLKEDVLSMNSQNIDFKNVSHPELESILNLKKILPATVNESGKIVNLSKNELTVKSDAYSELIQCVRA
ncbi:hypothetical protein OW492_07640 [Psychromonas sp. 14N.309.X.WAT.B.A12]|uniref:hypothetical protein n=1 Tax=Psychromonas sp. 14N.309.X.WAT.B.A12 TaxID=2998322 RepID=UPI0025B036A2|nr:hypothetical protein [Psychromonas sp. 14N.309.X.WAT.B.A12]MDN2663250.1 hypothetical protein [Psychromonas sp. 14N.309.X.WAT.B.A12]